MATSGYTLGSTTTAPAPTTFSTLQKQGVARPPSPTYTTMPAPTTQMAPATNTTKTAVPVNKVQQEGSGMLGGGYQQTAGPQPIGQGMFPAPQQPAPQPPPQQSGPGSQLGQDLYNRWRAPQQFQPGSNPFQGQLESRIGGQLANPSAYNSDMVLGTYNMLNQQLGQGYDYQRQQLQSEMARRGIDASTIHGQRYNDLGVEQARAQQNLAYQLMTDQAKQYGQDINTAISQAMGYGQQQFGQDTQRLNDYLGYGQQQWQNQFQTNQFNADQNNQMNQLLLALMGGLG